MCCSCFDKFAWMYQPFMKILRNSGNVNEKIDRFVKLKPSDSILDVGGGTGLSAEFFASKGNVTVLDPSKSMLSKIKNPKIRKVRGEAQKIPFKNKTFDLVYCIDSLHHFTNGHKKEQWDQTMDQCIYELLRVLKKEGSLIIVDFDPTKLGGKIIKFAENKILNWGSNFYTRKRLEKLFSKHNVILNFRKINKQTYIVKITKNS